MYTRLDTMTVMGPLQSKRETRKQPPRPSEEHDPTGSQQCRYHAKGCQHGNIDGGVSRQRQRPHNDGALKIPRPTQQPPPSTTRVVLSAVRASHTETPLPRPQSLPPQPRCHRAKPRATLRRTATHHKTRGPSEHTSHLASTKDTQQERETKREMEGKSRPGTATHPPNVHFQPRRVVRVQPQRQAARRAPPVGRRRRATAARCARRRAAARRRRRAARRRPAPKARGHIPRGGRLEPRKESSRGAGMTEGSWKRGKTAAGETP